MAQRSWKSADLLKKKTIGRDTYWQSTYSIKLPSAVKRASLLDLKLVQAFARVSLARDPITSFIFLIRSLDLLRDFALTLNSETPHTKNSKGLQSGELESQTSSTHTSVWSPWASSASLSWNVRRKVCRLSRLLKLPVDLSLLECVFLFFIYALAHSWDGLGHKNFSK